MPVEKRGAEPGLPPGFLKCFFEYISTLPGESSVMATGANMARDFHFQIPPNARDRMFEFIAHKGDPSQPVEILPEDVEYRIRENRKRNPDLFAARLYEDLFRFAQSRQYSKKDRKSTRNALLPYLPILREEKPELAELIENTYGQAVLEDADIMKIQEYLVELKEPLPNILKLALAGHEPENIFGADLPGTYS